MKTPRCDAHAENTKFTDSEGREALARDLEGSLGVWMQHAKEWDRKLAKLERELSVANEPCRVAGNDAHRMRDDFMKEVAELERENAALREEVKTAKADRDLAGWDDYAVISKLQREIAELKQSRDAARKEAQP